LGSALAFNCAGALNNFLHKITIIAALNVTAAQINVRAKGSCFCEISMPPFSGACSVCCNKFSHPAAANLCRRVFSYNLHPLLLLTLTPRAQKMLSLKLIMNACARSAQRRPKLNRATVGEINPHYSAAVAAAAASA
jgi:hypothetical protein